MDSQRALANSIQDRTSEVVELLSQQQKPHSRSLDCQFYVDTAGKPKPEWSSSSINTVIWLAVPKKSLLKAAQTYIGDKRSVLLAKPDFNVRTIDFFSENPKRHYKHIDLAIAAVSSRFLINKLNEDEFYNEFRTTLQIWNIWQRRVYLQFERLSGEDLLQKLVTLPLNTNSRVFLKLALVSNEPDTYGPALLPELLPEIRQISHADVNSNIFAGVCWELYEDCLKKGDHNGAYRNAVLYLRSSDNAEKLTEEDKKTFASNLAISGLLANDVYDLGDIIVNQSNVLLCMPSNLAKLLVDVNSGADITALDLPCKVEEKRDEVMFKVNVNRLLITIQRRRMNGVTVVPFQLLAEETGIAHIELESLILKCFSRGLMEGSIDQVDYVLTVTSLKPRTMTSLDEVCKLRDKVGSWIAKLQDTMSRLNLEETEK